MIKIPLNPFVGLKPYAENQNNSYFGREQEVENVLDILQKNKFVTFSGASGSGKTSLINAGLIPRLKKGFVGQAGKDWAIASFRPGIDPLVNLSYALTAREVLKDDLKSNTTDRKYYSEIISNFGSLGIVEIYKRSEIFGKKNLLIIIDQLEDLYKYNRYFDYALSEEDNVLMDLIYRTVTFKNTAIYFLICIETPYLTKLTSYNKLQEIISKSQYSIQNIDHKGIHQILKDTFYKKNIQFNSKVIDLFNETLKEEICYLPNLQFLLYKLYEKFVVNENEKTIIGLDDIDTFGGIKQSIEKDFENLYVLSSKLEQNRMANFFKSILDTQNLSSKVQYETILKISEHINISQSDLSREIRLLKKTFFDFFDVFEPSISGIPIAENKPFDSKNIISLKYTKFLNWERHSEWLEEEKNNFEDFKAFSEDAIKKNNNKVDFLKTPELESAIAWRDNSTSNKNWAKKYNLDFDQTINFINDSEQDDLRIKKEKSDQLARERNKDRKATKIAFTLAGFALIGLLIAYISYKTADEQRKIANEKEVEAREAEDFAKKEGLTARKAEARAKFEKQIAIDLKIKANAAKLDAQEKEQEAKKEKGKAQKESEKNRTLKELIELNSDFKDLVISLSSAEQENKNEEIRDLIDSSIVKQKRFNKLKKHDLIDAEEIKGDESILKLNQKILTILKGANSYGKTDMLLTKNKKNYSIRSFDILNNKKIAYAGDKGVINFYDLDKSKQQQNTSIAIVENYSNIEDRIRNLVYVHDSILVAITFSKKVFKINPKKDSVLTLKPFYKISEYKNDILDIFIDTINNKQFLITTDYIITFNNYNLPTKNLKYKNIKATYYRDSKLFIVSNNKVFVINENGNSEEILLDNNLSDVKGVDKIYVTKNYLFLGNKNGNVFWYDYKYDNVKNSKTQKFRYKFEDHSSSITSMFLEEDKNLLFTASLDNKIFGYNIDYASEFIRNSKANFVGHEKWIWDMNTYTDKTNQKFLITADEQGNLLTWYIDPEDFLENIKSLYEKKYLKK